MPATGAEMKPQIGNCGLTAGVLQEREAGMLPTLAVCLRINTP